MSLFIYKITNNSKSGDDFLSSKVWFRLYLKKKKPIIIIRNPDKTAWPGVIGGSLVDTFSVEIARRTDT